MTTNLHDFAMYFANYIMDLIDFFFYYFKSHEMHINGDYIVAATMNVAYQAESVRILIQRFFIYRKI